MFRILLLSDFHISDPANEPIVLRDAFYDEYINGMISKIRDEGISSIDCIIITGDFVHKGNVRHYGHALKIIEHFAKELSVEYEQIVTCIGNHDVVRYYENRTEYYLARKEYLSFSSCFANGYGQSISKRAQLIKLRENLHVVSIDSTLHAKEVGMPGKISTNDIDRILTSIKELGKNNLLLLCSHFPPIPQLLEPAPFDEDNADWYSQHIWTMAHELTHRLKDIRKPFSTLWFSGDVHKDFQLNIDEHYYITTGRFGTNDQEYSNFRRQAKIIELHTEPEDKSPPRIFQIEYIPVGHIHQTIGKWNLVKQNFQETSTGKRIISSYEASTEIQDIESKIPSSSAERAFEIQLIDYNLESLIYQNIIQKKLYIWGRYRTWNNLVSLSWIPIGPLVNNGDLLSLIVYNISKYVTKEILSNIDETKRKGSTIILGADCWGAVLSSQVSVATGINNIVYASRSGGEHGSKYESINSDYASIISQFKNVIILSDVVATGQSLKSTYERLKENISEDEFKNIFWHSISIICDKNKTNKVDLTFLSSISTACRKIAMPIIKDSDLPAEKILPSDIVW